MLERGDERAEPAQDVALADTVGAVRERGLFVPVIAYGENYDRLVEVKSRYDPENLFHRNQNVLPRRSDD